MAFWQKKGKDLIEMDQVIQQNPGILPAQLAKKLGVQRSTVMRRLPSLDEAGHLYYEDERGGLWPFNRKK
jgi:DNA-binding IclR family transcriptional regulator